jgi:hypothetical protein
MRRRSDRTIEEMGAKLEVSCNGYRGRSKTTLALLQACKTIIAETQPITVRGVCYRLFVAGLIDSMAVKNTQKISRLLVWAREGGLVPWESIVDESRSMETVSQWKDLEGYAASIERSYRRDFWAHQRNQVIVISEKATVAGILRPVLDEYGVTFFPVHGFNSATKMHDLAEQIGRGAANKADRKHFILLYVGDHDPSGMYMSEIDLPERLKRYGANDCEEWIGRSFDLRRIALIEDDIDDLPPFEAKSQDPRYRWYVENYGDEAWELDAMDPNELRERVQREIERYVNRADWRRHKQIEKAQRETTKKIARAMAGAK